MCVVEKSNHVLKQRNLHLAVNLDTIAHSTSEGGSHYSKAWWCVFTCKYQTELHTILANLLHPTTGSSQICIPTARIFHSIGLPGSQHRRHCPKAAGISTGACLGLTTGKRTEFYRLQELALYRLHIVNSFTVMEIPNAVWPWELTWSPFKGLSSEFPALAFSFHLFQLFWAHLCRPAGLKTWVGGKKEVLPKYCIPCILLG